MLQTEKDTRKGRAEERAERSTHAVQVKVIVHGGTGWDTRRKKKTSRWVGTKIASRTAARMNGYRLARKSSRIQG